MSGLVREGDWNTGDPRPPPRAAGCVVSRGSSGFVSVRGARTRLPGCVSRTKWVRAGRARAGGGGGGGLFQIRAGPEPLFCRCSRAALRPAAPQPPEMGRRAAAPVLGAAEARRVPAGASGSRRGWAKPTCPKCFRCEHAAHIS